MNNEPEWIINDLGELGVKIGNRCFFLYKGRNIEYEAGSHRYRKVGKREFGETCKPDAYFSKGYATSESGLYTEPVMFYEGLSVGNPADYEWKELPDQGDGE